MGITHIENGKRTDVTHIYGTDIIEDDWDTKSQINLGELATRLGALQGYDNRGRQLWSDDFGAEHLKWNTNVSLASISLDKTHVQKGNQSVVLSINVGNGSAEIFKDMYSPLTGIYGAEMTWSCTIPDFNELRFGLIVYDGTYKWTYEVYVATTDRSFRIPTEGISYVIIGSMTYEHGDGHFWHTWKFVADTNTGAIHRVMIDGIMYDASAHIVRHTVDASDPHLNLYINILNLGKPATDLYVDNVILTHLE